MPRAISLAAVRVNCLNAEDFTTWENMFSSAGSFFDRDFEAGVDPDSSGNGTLSAESEEP